MPQAGPRLPRGLLAIASTVLGTVPAFLIGPLAFGMRSEFPVTESHIGVAMALFFLTSAAVSFYSGRFADTVTAGAGMMVGLVVASVACVILGTFPLNTVGMIAVCPLIGVANGFIQPAANVAIVRSVRQARHGLVIGLKQAAVPTATLVAGVAVLGVASGALGWRDVYLILVIANAVLLVSTSVLTFRNRGWRDALPVVGRPGERAELGGLGPPPARTEVQRPGPSLLWLVAGTALAGSGAAVLGPFLVEGLAASGADLELAARALLMGSWTSILVRVGFGWIADRWGDANDHLRLASALLLVGSLGFVWLALGASQSWAAVTAGVVAFGAGWGWTGLLQYSVLARYRASPGLSSGRIQSAAFVGAVVGPPVFGFLSEYFSYTAAWLFAAGLVISGAWLLLRWTSSSSAVLVASSGGAARG